MNEQQAKQAILEFAEALSTAGIQAVNISYSGCGDEGQTEDPQLQDADGKPVTESSLLADLDLDTIATLMEQFIPEGYQNNDGGWGTVTFDVQRRKIRVEHNWYETTNGLTNRKP